MVKLVTFDFSFLFPSGARDPRWPSWKIVRNFVQEANCKCFYAVLIKYRRNFGSSWRLTEPVWSKDVVGSWRSHRNPFSRWLGMGLFFSLPVCRVSNLFLPLPAAVWSEAVAARWRLQRWLNYQQTTFSRLFFFVLFLTGRHAPKTFQWCKWSRIPVM